MTHALVPEFRRERCNLIFKIVYYKSIWPASIAHDGCGLWTSDIGKVRFYDMLIQLSTDVTVC